MYGAIPKPPDERDFIYDDFVSMGGEVKIDWDKGFDIRNIVGDLPFKDQQSSSSCVAQAWSYQVEVFNALEKEKISVSPKSIYPQIKLPNGGAYIYAGGRLITTWGALEEKDVPSHRADGSTDEDFMSELAWKNSELDKKASTLSGKDLRAIRERSNMDLFAKAILDNYGVVGGLSGENNGTWFTERPQPPKTPKWGHALYFGAFGKDEFGKFIASPNSWNNIVGKKWEKGKPAGYGWQKFYQNYFTDDLMFDPWTYTDKPNTPNEVDMLKKYQGKLIKNSDSPKVYWVSGKDFIWIKDEATFNLLKGFWGDWNTILTIPEPIKGTKTFFYE